MFPLLPLWGLRSILQTKEEREFRDGCDNEFLQKLQSKYTYISNGLIRTGDIVARLFQSEVLTPRERDDIQQLLPTPVRANEQLLNILMLKDNRSYNCLLVALVETDQEHITVILKREDICVDNEHSLMIQRNYTTLVDNLHADCGHLLDSLYEAQALTGREMADINAKPTEHEKNETLLNLASKFSPANFEKFLKALEESSQEHVVSIMTGKHYAETELKASTSTPVEQYKGSGVIHKSQEKQKLQDDSIHCLLVQHQQNTRHCTKIIKTSFFHLKRQPIKTMKSKFANLQDDLQIELSMKVASVNKKTVLPSGANLEICLRKLAEGFIQQKREVNRKQVEAEDMREIFRSMNDSVQNTVHQFEDNFKAENHALKEDILLHKTNNRHLDETLKTKVIELDNEKQKNRGLESQLRQNQDESTNLLKQRDELLKKLHGEIQTMNEELRLHRTNISHHEETWKAKLIELDKEKEKSIGLESQIRQNQCESSNLLKQRDELLNKLHGEIQTMDEELLLNRSNIRLCDETLKAKLIELENEKQKSIGLESQLRQNQDESSNLIKQRDELLKKLNGEIQTLNEELLLNRTNNRHLDETLKAKVIELDNEKQKSRELESQLQQNQAELSNLLKQRDELRKEFEESLSIMDENKKKLEDLLIGKDETVSELKQNLEQAKKEWQEEKEQLMNQIKELQVPRATCVLKPSYSRTDCFSMLVRIKKLLSTEMADLLQDGSYWKIRHIVDRPTIKEADLENFWSLALPYIIQRIKTWNGNVLSAQSIAAMVERTPKHKRSLSSSDDALQDRKIYPISRLDCLTYLINAADSIVVQDILRIISKFPMAIPFVIPDIEDNGKYMALVPAMQDIVIKWESTPGQIAENNLFSSPFQMIAVVRLGTNIIGKSTILNQLMRKQFMFSSRAEPGSRYGRPLTLDGTVEIVWLTQETCSDTTWKTSVCDHYKRNTEEVVILANLHGDALQYPDTLKYLEHLACSFIVFRMPNSTDDEFNQLNDLISTKNLVSVLVDPIESLDEESDIETIYTDSLTSDDTQNTVRSLLRFDLITRLSRNSAQTNRFYVMKKSKSLRYLASLQCKQSEEILYIVRKEGCFCINQLLLNIDIQQHTRWNESLKRLLKLSLDILHLQPNDAKKSLTYLENQLSQLSADESVTARAEVSEANEKLRRIIVKAPKKSTAENNSEERQHHEEFEKAQSELKSAMEKVDNINLGQKHLFRALGQMYEKSFGCVVTDLGDFNSIRDLPSRYADLLISGHAIEMLNGDSGEMQLVWIKAICDNVTKKIPNLKVFVMSIIGLQSSGKSTLLNALFSCRFAVSVRRCSRGLFMRMILIDEKIRKTYGCDAFILIDTEGLCSSEKMNDPRARQKDRLMATFAMGISNITIVNILGEGMTEMTQLLQIAIIAMARLRVGAIKPDILVVQHLQERNLSKIDQAKGQFCEAINKAFELISKNDVEIGSASEECLAELTARIQSGDIFAQFGAFRDGSSVNSPPSETYHEDVVNLFKTLLKRTKALANKSTFERWSNHFESYWGCVRGENFALNFKNVKHITDFLYFEKKVAKVRELNDCSIRHHRNYFANEIREKVNLVIENKQKVRTDSMRQEMLGVIEQKLKAIPHDCPVACLPCKEFKSNYNSLLQEIESSEWGEETRHSLQKFNDRLHEITMKVLRQTFDGSVVKQGRFSEFSDLITKELKQALERRPTGVFSPEEQREIVDNIWQFLQGIAASKEFAPDLHTRMTQALLQEYVNSGVQPDILKDLRTEISVSELHNTKAIKSLLGTWKLVTENKLGIDEMASLIYDLEQLVITILRSRREDYFTTGLDFDEGMVSEIRTKFPWTIKQFQEKFKINLYDSFKMRLQIYTLQQLRQKMTGLQSLWNSQNKPSEKLEREKDDYISEIETRLKSGFSCACEGEIVAKRLGKSIKLKAIQAGYDAKIQAVKDASWTTNSKKVRLHYFEQLAKEVALGKKKRALVHFANPKDSMESWFANEVDSLHSDKLILEIYNSILEHDLNRVKHQILNSGNKADIDKIVKEQFKNADDQYYSQLDPRDDDFDAFKSSIVRILDSFMDSEDGRLVEFGLASDDLDIQRRLGCCEHCHLCGALCWGSRDHLLKTINNRTMEMHHSCHQPIGFKGTDHPYTHKLFSQSCHIMKDNTLIHFGKIQEGSAMLWSDAKREYSKDWKFDAHCVTMFDELMRWFFQQLHRDIAESLGVSPADDKELREHGCTGLSLDKILEVVGSKI